MSLDEQMELPNLEVSALPSHLHIERVPSEPWQWTDGKRFSHGKKHQVEYSVTWEILLQKNHGNLVVLDLILFTLQTHGVRL